MTDKAFWMILVPTQMPPENRPIKTRYHRVWDKKVQTITGGLTILKPAVGYWGSPAGNILTERMIPVMILATKKQMDEIVDFTIEYYNQEAVLATKISDDFILKHRTKEGKNRNEA